MKLKKQLKSIKTNNIMIKRKNMSFEVTNPLTNEKMTIWDS